MRCWTCCQSRKTAARIRNKNAFCSRAADEIDGLSEKGRWDTYPTAPFSKVIPNIENAKCKKRKYYAAITWTIDIISSLTVNIAIKNREHEMNIYTKMLNLNKCIFCKKEWQKQNVKR